MKKVMGKGTVYLIISQIFFIFANYFVHIGLAHFFGAEVYGTFGVVMSIYLIVGSILNSGVPKAVSKEISGTIDQQKKVFRASLSLQLTVATIISIFLIIFSKQIAIILKDVSLTKFVILLGFMTIPFSLYTLSMSGFLNGLRMFKQQASTAIFHYSSRFIFVFLFVFLGLGVWGSFFGYLTAIIIGLIITILYLRNHLKNILTEPVNKIYKLKLWQLAMPLTVIALCFTLLRNSNILFVKAFISDSAKIGYFTAATALSNIPYTIFLGLPLTLLPSVSNALATNNFKLAQKYVMQSLRYLLFLIMPVVALMSGAAAHILAFFYQPEYASASITLALLTLSSMLLAIFMTLGTVLVAANQQKKKLTILLGVIPLFIVGNIILIPLFGLEGAAINLIFVSALANLFVTYYIKKYFQKFIELKSLFVIIFCSVVIFALSRIWNFTNSYSFIFYLVFGTFVYLLLLWLFGEIKKEDKEFLFRLIKIKNN